MRLLADQDVYAATTRFLVGLGHDVVTAAQLGLATAADSQLILSAQKDGRILVTRDRDYGSLVFIHKVTAGILYLRMVPSTLVEPGRHRLRRLGP